MSKAEELSRLYVLPFLDKQYKKYGEHKQMELSRFDGYDMMSSYEEGYHQAEKDLELDWEDINSIKLIIEQVECDYVEQDKKLYTKYFYEEVLKRFKDLKK